MSESTDVNKVLAIWQDNSQLKTIKSIYAPDLTENEFQTYVQMGMATRLNPFLREIWAVKYDKTKPAQIFIGRDGYRKIISRNPDYDMHICSAVFSNDEFHTDIVNVEVKHVPNLKDRGKLMGAFCLVYMKNKSKPYYAWVDFDEYNKKFSNWLSMPITMIKKVAECQAIRMADSTCSGSYDEDEMPDETKKPAKSAKLNRELGLEQGRTIEGERIDQQTGEIIENVQGENTSPADMPLFTFEEIRSKMETANTVDILTEAASVISEMQITAEQRADLSKIYREKLKELKKI